jgi:hypothetical protein
MVGFAPGQGPLTVGEDTAAVADREGVALGGLDDPGGPADLQRLGRGPTQGRGQQGRGGSEPPFQPLDAVGIVSHRWRTSAGPRVAMAGMAKLVVAGLAGHDHSGQGPVTGQPSTRLRVQRPGPPGLASHGVGVAQEAV